MPTLEEDAAINAGIAADPDTFELDDAWFAKARRGRPTLPSQERRQRVNLMLDPDIAERLRASKNMSALVNQLLRTHLEK